MPSQIREPGLEHPAPESQAQSVTFRDFLEQKADEYKIRGQHQRRETWLATIRSLFEQLKTWLKETDPEGLLEILEYQVARYDRGLGSYDAPALKIRLGPSEVDIIPITHDDQFYSLRDASSESASFMGRIDITDGVDKCHLLQKIEKGSASDSWQIKSGHDPLVHLTKREFERVLQDYLS